MLKGFPKEASLRSVERSEGNIGWLRMSKLILKAKRL